MAVLQHAMLLLLWAVMLWMTRVYIFIYIVSVCYCRALLQPAHSKQGRNCSTERCTALSVALCSALHAFCTLHCTQCCTMRCTAFSRHTLMALPCVRTFVLTDNPGGDALIIDMGIGQLKVIHPQYKKVSTFRQVRQLSCESCSPSKLSYFVFA